MHLVENVLLVGFVAAGLVLSGCGDDVAGTNTTAGRVNISDSGETDDDTGVASAKINTTGYNMLMMGHSFFKPYADRFGDMALDAGFVDHTDVVVMRGGAKGLPISLWNIGESDDAIAKQARATIVETLDKGGVEIFGMVMGDPHSDTATVGISNWVTYALQNNPDVTVFISISQPTNPSGGYAWIRDDPYVSSNMNVDFENCSGGTGVCIKSTTKNPDLIYYRSRKVITVDGVAVSTTQDLATFQNDHCNGGTNGNPCIGLHEKRIGLGGWDQIAGGGATVQQAFASHIKDVHEKIIDPLRVEFPTTKFFTIPTGWASVDLWQMLNDNLLLDESIAYNNLFRDTLGHQEDIIQITGTLMWLNAVYNVDLDENKYDTGFKTDLHAVAAARMEQHDPAYKLY